MNNTFINVLQICQQDANIDVFQSLIGYKCFNATCIRVLCLIGHNHLIALTEIYNCIS